MPLGVEFSGGTIVIVKFDQQPDLQQVRTRSRRRCPAAARTPWSSATAIRSANQVMVRVPDVGAESGGSLSQAADARRRQAAARAPTVRQPASVVGTEIVGPTRRRGADSGRAFWRPRSRSAGILIYIALRFRFSFAVGAVVATIHDLLITLAFLAFFRYDLSLNVIAAILTITGYSINDTIVIFDRVRENMRRMRGDDLAQIVNAAVNQTLGRTIITAGLTLLSRARAVPLRRRSAARLRLHDDRRHHHRHLLERVHRRGDRA